ncbi:phage/plasmid primase, P4 family [Alienimonas californiensis]|uniref:phage/plasmid primase, P4 family n=1 Tax=Alienimonas californiensis TaxID=2527989 RepID=UPI0011A140C6|nr:phage/plasmid primase, P4 family [Alienimonas californiensis]
MPHHRKELEEGAGLTAGTIREARIRSAGPVEATERLGWANPNPKLGNAMLLPLDDTPDGPVQAKFDRPLTGENGKPRKYETTRGHAADAYIPPDARDGVLTTKAPVVITEGIKKALKAVQEGIPTIALLGLWMFKVKGEERLVPGLEQVDWDGREVTIVFDSDGRTNRSVRQAAVSLAELLKAAGAEVKVLFLPPGPNGKKVGIDDFLLAHPVEELEALIADAGPPESIEDAGRRKAGLVDPEELGSVILVSRAVDGVPGVWVRDGEIYQWDKNRFVDVSDDEFKLRSVTTLKPHFVEVRPKVVSGAVMHAKADALMPRGVGEGDWIVGGPPDGWADPAEVFPAANGLLHLPFFATRAPCLIDHTPRRFTRWVSPVPYDPTAPRPETWLRFLHDQLFPGRPEPVRLLRQFAGGLLMQQAVFQKMLMMIGPGRSGKGTIMWVFESLLGPEMRSAVPLKKLGGQFDGADLLDKRLLSIGDLRLPTDRRSREAPIEMLLSLSGGDPITFDRKYKEPVTARPPVRIVIASNELPVLPDPSGVIASRFVGVKFTDSFDGVEDPRLKDKLRPELPAILNWALAGYLDLIETGRLVEPAGSDGLRAELEALASPVKVFVKDACVLGANEAVPAAKLRELFSQ